MALLLAYKGAVLALHCYAAGELDAYIKRGCGVFSYRCFYRWVDYECGMLYVRHNGQWRVV